MDKLKDILEYAIESRQRRLEEKTKKLEEEKRIESEKRIENEIKTNLVIIELNKLIIDQDLKQLRVKADSYNSFDIEYKSIDCCDFCCQTYLLNICKSGHILVNEFVFHPRLYPYTPAQFKISLEDFKYKKLSKFCSDILLSFIKRIGSQERQVQETISSVVSVCNAVKRVPEIYNGM